MQPSSRHVSIDANALLAFIILFAVSFIVVLLAIIYIFPFSGDYFEYYKNFMGLGGERFEIGYKAVQGFYQLIFPSKSEINFLMFIAVLSMLSLSLKCIVATTIQPNIILVFMFVYFPYLFLLHEANQIRASLAIAVAVLAILFMYKNRTTMAVFTVFVSILFHYSMVLFFIPLVFLIFHKHTMKLYYASGLLIVCLLSVFDPALLGNINPLVNKYIVSALDYSFNPFYIILLSSIFIIGLTRYRQQSQFQNALLNGYFITFCFAMALSNIPIIAVRIMDIANVIGFYYVFSIKISSSIKVLVLYLLLFAIALPRFYVFMTTDTIYKFG